MAQTLFSVTLLAGEKRIMFEKPRVLRRIFFSVRALADEGAWYKSVISFGDPMFRTFYVLNGPAKYFEAKGEGIFQGDVWVSNLSNQNLEYTATEILI